MKKRTLSLIVALAVVISSFFYSTTLGYAVNDISENEHLKNETSKDAALLEESKTLLTKEELPAVVRFENARKYGHVQRISSSEKNEYTLAFRNEDNTETQYLFAYPVKYVDSNGEWKDISMKLAYDKELDGYTTVQSNIMTEFSKRSSDGISLKYDDTNIKLVPLTQNPIDGVLSQDNEKVEYRLNDKTSYEYSLTYCGFKEDIIVSEYTGQTDFRFRLYTNGLKLAVIGEEYYLTDDKGNIKANIGDVIIFTEDEKNNGFGKMISETVNDREEYILTIHVDDDYLTDPNTTYPIRIDPTIEVNSGSGSGAIQDVTIHSLAGSNGSSSQLFVAKRASLGISRVLMKFPGLDLSGYAAPEIINAVVEIRDISCQTSQQPIYCYKFNGPDWSEATATWNSVSPNSYTTYLSGNTVSYSNGLNQTVAHRYQFSILSAVRSWTTSPASQKQGIMFKTSNAIENGTQDISRTFASFNATIYQPSLIVTLAARTTTDWGTTIASGGVVTGNNRHYTFICGAPGTYHFKTEQYLGAPSRDTVLYLYDVTHNTFLTSNDNASSNTDYSYISYNLSVGVTYRVFVCEASNVINNMDCYLILYKDGCLDSPLGFNQLTKNFKRLKSATNVYNCLAYVITGEDSPEWIWPWSGYEPTISEVTAFMSNNGYYTVPSPANPYCIVAYGHTNNNETRIAHFSRILNGVTTAKLGNLELVQHNNYDAYFENGDYGEPKAYYYGGSKSVESIDTSSEIKRDLSKFKFNKEYKEYVYSVIEEVIKKFELKRDKLSSAFPCADDYMVEYNMLAELGETSVPYIFCYITESKNNGYDEAFLCSCIKKMIGYKEPVIEKYSTNTFEYTAKGWTNNLWKDVRTLYILEK